MNKKSLFLLFAVLLLGIVYLSVPAWADDSLFRLQYTEYYSVNYGEGHSGKMGKPYQTWFFINDSEIYHTNGALYQYTGTPSSDGGMTVHLITSPGSYEGDAIYVGSTSASASSSWYGGRMDYTFAVLRTAPAFRSQLSVPVQKGNAVLFDCSARDGAGDYTYHYDVFNENSERVYYGETKNSSFFIPLKTDGTYRIFLYAVDAEKDVSEYSMRKFSFRYDPEAEPFLKPLQYYTNINYNYYGSVPHPASKPYDNWYFIDNSTIYVTGEAYSSSKSGRLFNYTWDSTNNDIFRIQLSESMTYGVNVVTVNNNSANATSGWSDGGERDYNFYVLNDPFTFTCAISSVTQKGNNLLVDCKVTGGAGDCSYDYDVFNASGARCASGETKELPITIPLEETGDYRVFVTAIDADLERSDYNLAETHFEKKEFGFVQKKLRLCTGLAFAKAALLKCENMDDPEAELTWATGDAGVATVQDGLVRAVGPGKTTITATQNGKTASCEVEVYESLTGLKMPNHLKVLQKESFSGNNACQYVYLPKNMNAIGAQAFAENDALLLVYIPASVKTFGNGIFAGSDSVIVVCQENSGAESYCVENGIAYQIRAD